MDSLQVLILLTFETEDKIISKQDIDRIITAEIANPDTHPRLYAVQTSQMVHRPCGPANPKAPCNLPNGQCKYGYPKDFREETEINEQGYPSYRRRNTGEYLIGRGKTISNQNILPTNPFLCLMLGCHIFIEICSSFKSVKYVHKYIHKGYDKATVTIKEVTASSTTAEEQQEQKVNEEEQYVNARYISSAEAYHRTSEFSVHGESHTVVRLLIHLPNEQPLLFEPGEEQEALQRSESKKTQLQAFFELCHRDPAATTFHTRL